MNKNINDFIYNAAMLLIFIVALTLFFTIHHALSKTPNQFDNLYEKEIVLPQKTLPCNQIVYGHAIISQLYKGLEKDIIIDGVFISKDIHREAYGDFGIEAKGYYRVHKVINENGQVERVVYNKE